MHGEERPQDVLALETSLDRLALEGLTSESKNRRERVLFGVHGHEPRVSHITTDGLDRGDIIALENISYLATQPREGRFRAKGDGGVAANAGYERWYRWLLQAFHSS